MKRIIKSGLVIAIIAAFFAVQTSDIFAADRVSYEQYLIQSLTDQNLGRRASAARILGENKTAEAIEPLFTMLKNEDDYRLRIVAAVSLYRIGDHSILQALEEIAKKEQNKTAKQVMFGIVCEINDAAAKKQHK